ncbi:hypothetical protein J0H58_39160 [bacterium]|nr:hypothetical protein [bacterium]
MAFPTAGVIGAGVAVGGLAAFWVGRAWVERRQRSRVMADGVPVVGWLVQANATLFHPGGEDAPAQLLICFDAPGGEGLGELAAEVGRLKSEPPATEVERVVAALVRDETYRPGVRLRLPDEFTGGREVYAADVWVERRLLPEGRLTDRQLACLAIPGVEGRVYLEPPARG